LTKMTFLTHFDSLMGHTSAFENSVDYFKIGC
jgi:hypothetical protein